MASTVRVDLHCHSSFSDGGYTPEQLAERLSRTGVQYAALTDHDTVEGQRPFRRALAEKGLVAITGVEMAAHLEKSEIHLLGFGVDPDHPELLSALDQRRKARVAGSPYYAPERRYAAVDTIGLIQRAGGLAVLAHPLLGNADPAFLEQRLVLLREAGLDGVEAFHPDASPAEQERLRLFAEKHSLLITAGSDSHLKQDGTSRESGMDIPAVLWKAFRDRLLATPSRREEKTAAGTPSMSQNIRPQWRPFLFNVAVPAAAALLLFVSALFFVFLPALERALLERKREMIRELTRAAWGVLREAAQEEQEGRVAPETARAQACARISAMRYGSEGKDYFWLQDLSPRMIMHPYRTDLNGKDLSEFKDARGARIFKVFADLAREKKGGYVDYVWQWKDDPRRLEPKESYILLFDPWGWIIGTGLYIQDVREESRKLWNRLALLSAVVGVVVALLLIVVVRAGLRLERRRTLAEQQSRESAERYRTLVESATEGALFVHSGRCRYANPIMLGFIKCQEEALEFLDLDDVFPDVPENASLRARLERPDAPAPSGTHAPALLRRRDNTDMACTAALKRVTERGQDGCMVLVRPAEASPVRSAAGDVFIERLLGLPVSIGRDLAGEISAAATAEAVVATCRRAPDLVQSLLDNGAYAPGIARMLSSITDAATQRLVSLAMKELGPAPAPFAFIALGSQGRQEQTLFTDQDNAIIYRPGEAENAGRDQDYFLALAGRVCAGLNQSGYRECRGKVMASNAEWCRPLPDWKGYFEKWIQKAEPRELMEFSLFFDFRAVAGEKGIEQELRAYVLGLLKENPRFYAQAALQALEFKAPLRFFGAIVSTRADADHPGRLDLKAAALPIVSFTRLYSLKEAVAETNTLSRLEALSRKGVILDSKRGEIAMAHDTLLRLRLRHQTATIRAGREPDNWVDPGWLGHLEEALLKECFSEVDLIQNRIRRDFPV